MLSKLHKRRKGFTLIELMIVVAIIGILAAIAIPQYSKLRKKGMHSAAKMALDSVANAQDLYYNKLVEEEQPGEYTDTLSDLESWYVPESGIVVTFIGADANSWSAYAKHTGAEEIFTYVSGKGLK
jgi:type IV pilus assembly protein PilA